MKLLDFGTLLILVVIIGTGLYVVNKDKRPSGLQVAPVSSIDDAVWNNHE